MVPVTRCAPRAFAGRSNLGVWYMRQSRGLVEAVEQAAKESAAAECGRRPARLADPKGPAAVAWLAAR
jgi:hypothetical protein